MQKKLTRGLELIIPLICRRTSSKSASNEFYAHHGAENRIYFYVLDDRGLLYLEQTLNEVKRNQEAKGKSTSGTSGRNITTAIKDPKFLNFFYKQLKLTTKNSSPSSPSSPSSLVDRFHSGIDVIEYTKSYPLLSLCGKEKNFLVCDDPIAVLGFTDIKDGNLIYGAGSKEPFLPDSLVFSKSNGRVYHLITQHPHLKGNRGLLHPHLAAMLTSDAYDNNNGNMCYTYKGCKYQLQMID